MVAVGDVKLVVMFPSTARHWYAKLGPLELLPPPKVRLDTLQVREVSGPRSTVGNTMSSVTVTLAVSTH